MIFWEERGGAVWKYGMIVTDKSNEKKEGRMEGRKMLPIGIDDFGRLRENNAYYVDKTLMIQAFIEM